VGILAMAIVVSAKPLAAAFPSFGSSLAPLARIAWPWYVLIGTTITIATGMLSSLSHPMPEMVNEVSA
jgi:solute:Na+ symporter, SSS family